jgi:hypothetical protein
MSLEVTVVLERVREILGDSCDPQLRRVSKSCCAALADIARKNLHVKDFLSSLELFTWARSVLRMPNRKDICNISAAGGHLEVYCIVLYCTVVFE